MDYDINNYMVTGSYVHATSNNITEIMTSTHQQ